MPRFVVTKDFLFPLVCNSHASGTEAGGRIIEETQDCMSPTASPLLVSTTQANSHHAKNSVASTSGTSTSSSTVIADKARLSRSSRRKVHTEDSQITDPTYDPFMVESVQRAVLEANSSEYKRSLRQRK